MDMPNFDSSYRKECKWWSWVKIYFCTTMIVGWRCREYKCWKVLYKCKLICNLPYQWSKIMWKLEWYLACNVKEITTEIVAPACSEEGAMETFSTNPYMDSFMPLEMSCTSVVTSYYCPPVLRTNTLMGNYQDIMKLLVCRRVLTVLKKITTTLVCRWRKIGTTLRVLQHIQICVPLGKSYLPSRRGSMLWIQLKTHMLQLYVGRQDVVKAHRCHSTFSKIKLAINMAKVERLLECCHWCQSDGQTI